MIAAVILSHIPQQYYFPALINFIMWEPRAHRSASCAMLMRPKKAKTAVHECSFLGSLCTFLHATPTCNLNAPVCGFNNMLYQLMPDNFTCQCETPQE